MPIYLDNNATTALDPRVLEAMQPWLTSAHGNPSSVHRYGRLTRGAIDHARQQVANWVGVSPDYITFTSGGTEANNLALKGMLAASKSARIVTSPTEHPCIFEAAETLQANGTEVEWLPVDQQGHIQADAFAQALRQPTALVSVMRANNETGVIQDIAALAAIAAGAGVPMHCDAVQAAGKMPLQFADLGVQLMTLSAHKIYGPKAVGALVIDPAVDIKSTVQGGGQERGLRPGTENVAGIVGFGAAAELALQELSQRQAHNQQLIDQLDAGLRANPGITVFADGAQRLSNTRQFALAGWEGEALLMELDRRGIAVSSGSACHSGTGEPSHVLLGMGIERNLAYGAIRVSVGKDNHPADIDALLQQLSELTLGVAS